MDNIVSALLDEGAAARLLGLSTHTLRAWRAATRGPRGPRFVRCGRSVRYRLADLETWMAANTFGGDAVAVGEVEQ